VFVAAVNNKITDEKLHQKTLFVERKVTFTLLIRKLFSQVNLIFIKIKEVEIY
jgi:hypothetical protein